MLKLITYRVPGGEYFKKIVEIAAMYEGNSIGEFVRNCIGKEIGRQHHIEVTEVDYQKIKSRKAIKGSAREAILSIIKEAREAGQKIVDSTTEG